MTTVGKSTFSLTGTLGFDSPRRSSNIALSQSIGGLEVKGPIELTIAAGATVSLPLSFSTGVSEALVLALYSAARLDVALTASGDVPGPVKLGMKGNWVQTFAPGRGLAAVSVTNPSTTESVALEYAYAALADAGDAPEFWE
jgi:hypothetical protein